MILVEYPGLRLDEGAGRVVGEIYEVPRATLAALDELEGFDPERAQESEYVRVAVRVEGDEAGAAVEECWVYEISERVAVGRRRIASGDWMLDRGAGG